MREIDDRSVIYEWKKSSLFECETGTVCSTAGLSGHWSLRLSAWFNHIVSICHCVASGRTRSVAAAICCPVTQLFS